VVTSKQRREQSRRLLERQLQARQRREAARRRRALIATIAGTVVLAVVVVIVVVAVSGSGKKKPSASNTTPPTASSAPSSPVPAATGPSVSFDGVTVKGATDLSGAPGVTSKSAQDPAKLEYKDLVVGKGKAATPKSTVSVQYAGALYKTGTEFDSSWTNNGGKPVSFSLTGVVPGFTRGIGGTTGVPAMKAGGRRIIIMPAALGYGPASPSGSNIPPNSSLVFVVDLKTVS
jgi:peptidylprolyl isomerase